MSYLALSMTCIDKAICRNFTHNQFTFTYKKKSAIIDRRIVTRRRRPTNEVLIQWANLPKEDATWENYDDLKIKFPEFMNHQPRGQG